jgi:hypothetical protein
VAVGRGQGHHLFSCLGSRGWNKASRTAKIASHRLDGEKKKKKKKKNKKWVVGRFEEKREEDRHPHLSLRGGLPAYMASPPPCGLGILFCWAAHSLRNWIHETMAGVVKRRVGRGTG